MDSITTSSTPYSTNHSDSHRRWSGGTKLAPRKLILAFDFDVGQNHRQHLNYVRHSRYPVRHKLPPGGRGERAPSSFNQGRRLSPLPSQGKTTPNYLLNHARSGSDSYTASTFPLSNRSSTPSLPYSARLETIFIRFRGPKALNR